MRTSREVVRRHFHRPPDAYRLLAVARAPTYRTAAGGREGRRWPCVALVAVDHRGRGYVGAGSPAAAWTDVATPADLPHLFHPPKNAGLSAWDAHTD